MKWGLALRAKARAGLERLIALGRYHWSKQTKGLKIRWSLARIHSKANPKVAQSIMRHSDINLTMSLYTHTLRSQDSEAIAKLPQLSKQRKLRGDRTG